MKTCNKIGIALSILLNFNNSLTIIKIYLIKFNKFDKNYFLYQTKMLNINTLIFLLKNNNNFKRIF